MIVAAIDPGTEQSAIVVYDSITKDVRMSGIHPNEYMLGVLLHGVHGQSIFPAHLAIEMIASYGMPVGREVFETCVWIGRFIEAWGGRNWTYVYRRDVKLHLCDSPRAKDANVRQAIIDKFPATGGGKTPQIGTKAQPGPLFGMKSHLWAALGVAVTYAETRGT